MKENKYFSLKDLRIYLIFAAITTLVLLYTNLYLGGLSIVAFAFILYYAIRQADKKNEEAIDLIENMSEDFDSATKHAIFNMPFPLVILGEDGSIIWYNTPFLDMFEEKSIMNLCVEKIVPDIKFDTLKNQELNSMNVKLKDDTFVVYPNIIDTAKTSSEHNVMYMLYFVKNTDYSTLENKYLNERHIVTIIEVDNYDEAMDSTPSTTRPLVIAEIDSIIRSYFYQYGALVRKFDDDLYMVVMDYQSLNKIRDLRFDVLDKLRALNKGNNIPITLSIGVSSVGLGFKDAYIEADTCLDVALGRGGDQAVVRVEDNYEFFGGKSKAVEKRNKVKARVLGMALRQLIDKASDVYIMGHKNADMDAIGSGIGVLRAVNNRNRRGYIVLNSINPSIENLYKRMLQEQPEIKDSIISGEDALDQISPQSLLILVDNHKPSFTEHPKLLDVATSVVIIDHHRRGKEFVENPVLTYVEPYASSTSELVTEMLTYMSDDLNLTHFEADALMSGIVVDTKNFSFQTGVRTFEAASTLRRAGADMTKVRGLFEDDYETIQLRAEVIHNAKIIHKNIAIGILKSGGENSILIAAQAADELLDIHGVKASFVLTKKGNEVHISGRSLGDISVQLILEKVGGGGHLTMAGAQIKTDSMEEAETLLNQAIESYLKEGAET